MDISLHKQEQPIANTDTVLANTMATTLPSNLANGKAGPSDKEFESLSIEDSFADAATDQVYEAKANKLNEAVRPQMHRYLTIRLLTHGTDSSNRHGSVSVADGVGSGIWLGQRQHVANCNISDL